MRAGCGSSFYWMLLTLLDHSTTTIVARLDCAATFAVSIVAVRVPPPE